MGMAVLQRLQSLTPKVWRQIGNTLLAISTSISGYTMYTEDSTVALIAMVTGVVGKVLTELFIQHNNEA